MKALSESQLDYFHQNGFLFPFDVYTPEEASEFHRKFLEMEKNLGHEPQKRFRIKAQLPFPWLCNIVSNPRLLDAVEDIIGPNILCWGASFFTKKANDPRFVSWHTDSFFYGFEPAETLTAWLGFNDSNLESGCIKYIPGTHKQEVEHDIRPHPDNLVQLGQMAIGVDYDSAIPAILSAGQVVFHHESVVHGSGPNGANHDRIGLAIHYVAPHVKETRFDGLTAMTLRGENTSGNWGEDPRPTRDYDERCIEAMDATRALFTNSTAQKIEEGGRS